MKKAIGTMAAATVLPTAAFSFAEFAAARAGSFPSFPLGCLSVGGLILCSLKHKSERMSMSEAIGAFAGYTVLTALFPNPGAEAVKTWVSRASTAKRFSGLSFPSRAPLRTRRGFL